MIRISLDAMGGDNAPVSTVEGALSALKINPELHVILVGKEEQISSLLKGADYDSSRLSVVNADEIIETGEHPVEAIRKKKNSSLVVGMKLVHDGEADAFVSAGNSGALMVGSQVLIGREKGVQRAPFAHIVPTAKGKALLLDCGANVDVRPEHLVSFAVLGTGYMKKMYGIDNPRAALVNIGTEETKGNELVLSAYPMLKECAEINFTGNIEPTGITAGDADVLICDGFTGNTIIKMYEGLGKLLMQVVKKGLTKDLKTKLGALLVKDSLKEEFRPFDSHEYGGAPILGLKGLVLKTHGNAAAREICNSLLQCAEYKK